MGIDSYGNMGHSHSHTSFPIPIYRRSHFQRVSHSHGICISIVNPIPMTTFSLQYRLITLEITQSHRNCRY